MQNNNYQEGNHMSLEFKPISAKDIDRLTPFYAMRRNQTCDSVFLESFLWREYYNVRYAIWEEKALLWLMEYRGRVFSAMPLCREEDLEAAFLELERYFNEELGYPLVINLADEAAVKCLNLPPERYLVKEEEGASDYIYSAEALKTLAGKKLHKKKNNLNYFKKTYEGRYEYKTLTCDEIQDVWKFLDHWREGKGEDVEEHLDYEVRGIHEILRNCCRLNIRMGGIYVDGELEAFSIGSYNPLEKMAVIHIEKANPDMRGLYQLINQQFLIEEFPDAETVNREDDLGLEGLRKAKMSYCPIDFAKKYLVEQVSFGQGTGDAEGFHWAENIGTLADEPEEERKLSAAQLPGDGSRASGADPAFRYPEETRGEDSEAEKNGAGSGGTECRGSENGRVLAGAWKTDAIHYADMEEKQLCRNLWHEAFPEDSIPFADYYYKEKTKDNRILAKGEDGRLAAMIQLNPYTFVCRGGEWDVDYIVGVATAKDKRHRGHMSSLLSRMLEDMHRERVPFTFLMPASEAIYRPFQFAFIYRQPKFRLTEEAVGRLERRPCAGAAESGEPAEAAAFMEQWIGSRYEAYCRRDSAYVERLIRELASEEGTLDFLWNGERLAGLQAEWGLNKKEQRLLYADSSLTVEEKEKEEPAIMARVTDVEAFFRMISGTDVRADETKAGRGEENEELAGEGGQGRKPDGILKISDPFLPACGGYYEIFTDKKGGAEARKAEGERERAIAAGELAGDPTISGKLLSLPIDGLAQWLFGYRTLSEIAKEDGCRKEGPSSGEADGPGGASFIGLPAWTREIRPLAGVFIDETV